MPATSLSRQRRTCASVIALVLSTGLTACPAHAQDPYVGAALVGNIVRTSGLVDSDGESLGWSLRVGTPLGDRWGVDAEFVLSGTYELEVATERIPASVSLEAPYDPANARIRA